MEFNFEKEIKCICGTIFELSDFKNHFTECDKFKECFNDFDNQLSKFIQSYSKPKEQLLIIKFILKLYIKMIDKQIRGNYVEISKAFKDSFLNSLQENNAIDNKLLNSNKNNNNINDYDKHFSFKCNKAEIK